MSLICLTLIILFNFTTTQIAEDIQVLEVIKFLQEFHPEAIRNEEHALALSIGAPEIIRYHYFRDFLETESLQLLYVKYGSEVFDFSIGPFQMKPSFVELLEEKLKKLGVAGDFCHLTEYANKDEEEIRKERLQRMQQAGFQLQYLLAFSYVCEHQFGTDLRAKSSQEKLGFMATAYNLGLNHSADQIWSYAGNAYFPFGKAYPGKQYAYGELAITIYQQLNN